MSVNRGKRHTCVGMYIEPKENGSVEVLTKEYLLKSTTAFGEPVDKSANTPAKHDFLQ